jgi:hypothetical protein
MPIAVLVGVRAIATNVARATFDRSPRAFDPTALHDALNPRNWTVARLGGGFAPPVVRVDKTGATSTLDLVFLNALDEGADYDVVALSAIEAVP